MLGISWTMLTTQGRRQFTFPRRKNYQLKNCSSTATHAVEEQRYEEVTLWEGLLMNDGW